MAAEIPLSDNEFAIILLLGFFGIIFGFSLATIVARKFSKHKNGHKLVKLLFIACFGLSIFFHIVNINSSIENEPLELYLPANVDEAFLLGTKLMINYNPFLILQIPLMLVIIGILRMSGPIPEDGKYGFKLILIFSVAFIAFMLISAEPPQVFIGMFTGFQLGSIVGIYMGIKNTTNTHLFVIIIRWMFGKDILKAS